MSIEISLKNSHQSGLVVFKLFIINRIKLLFELIFERYSFDDFIDFLLHSVCRDRKSPNLPSIWIDANAQNENNQTIL